MSHRLIYVVGVVLMVSPLMAGVAGAADPTLVGWWKMGGGSRTSSQGSNAPFSNGRVTCGTRVGGGMGLWWLFVGGRVVGGV